MQGIRRSYLIFLVLLLLAAPGNASDFYQYCKLMPPEDYSMFNILFSSDKYRDFSHFNLSSIGSGSCEIDQLNNYQISTRPDLPPVNDLRLLPKRQEINLATTDDLRRLIAATVDEELPQADILSNEEFSFAGHPRYVLFGSLPLRQSQLKPAPFITTGVVYLGIIVGLHIYQINTFWTQRSDTINFREDRDWGKQVDKFGHFFGGLIMSYYSTEALQSTGVSVESSRIWGSVMGLLYQTYVEVEDGFGTDWGFSPSDVYLNVAGAGFYLLQFYVPALQNVTEKWIYTPAPWINETKRLNGETFIDDYSSSTFFVSLKVNNILPANLRQYWLPWLNIAAGYACRGLDTPQEDKKFIVALDYDLPELLPDFSKLVGGHVGDFLNWLKQSFNYFKFPSPALEFGDHGMTRFNLLYPFKLSIGNFKF